MKQQLITKNIDLSQIDLSNKKELESLSEKILEEMKQTGQTFAQVIGLDETILEQGYSFAYTHYKAGQYTEALAIFESLINFAPTTYKFVFGIAACIYQLKHYEEAAQFFYAAMLIDQTNPFPIYYIAECALKKNYYKEAITALDYAIELTEKKSEYETLSTRCLLLRRNLTNKG